MRKRHWGFLGLAVAAAAAGVWFWSTRSLGAIDLVVLFDEAEKKSSMPMHQAFSVGDFTLGGEKRRGIFAHPSSEIRWRLTLPDHPRLDVALGISEESWGLPGDGVRFRIGVESGGAYKPLYERHLYPGAWAMDRGWQPVSLDLSRFARRPIDLVFSTHASATGELDPRNDWAMWGSPAIVRARVQ